MEAGLKHEAARLGGRRWRPAGRLAAASLAVALWLPSAGGRRIQPAYAQQAPAAAGAAAKAAPLAVVDRPVYDFGAVWAGEPVSHIFHLRNQGTAPLELRGYNPSCGCTVAKPSRTLVPPGQSSELSISYDTRGEHGRQNASVEVLTNDPLHPTLALQLTGTVKPEVEAVPSEVAFGKIARATSQSREVAVKDRKGGAPFALRSLSNSNPFIKVARIDPDRGSDSFTLKITVTAAMPAGPFADTVKVTTNRAELDLDVFGTVTGPLEVEPAQVSFGVVGSPKGVVRLVRFRNRGAHPVRIVRVESSSRAVSASVETLKPGEEYKIALALSPDAPQGQLRGAITITTDDARQAVLTIPFYGIVGRL